MTSAHVAIQVQARGPNSTIMSDWAAGQQAVGEAAEWIRAGETDAVLAGGADSAIQPFAYAAYEQMGLFAEHDGPRFVPGEGAAIMLLEEREAALAANRRPACRGRWIRLGRRRQQRRARRFAVRGDASGRLDARRCHRVCGGGTTLDGVARRGRPRRAFSARRVSRFAHVRRAARSSARGCRTTRHRANRHDLRRREPRSDQRRRLFGRSRHARARHRGASQS